MLFINYTIFVYFLLVVGLVGVPKEPSIRQIIAFLVTLSGILGAILTFFLTLPPSEIIFAMVGIITTVIAVIAAAIKMLREMEKVVEKEVTVRVNNQGV